MKTAEEILINKMKSGKYTNWHQEPIGGNNKWIISLMKEYAEQEREKAFKQGMEMGNTYPQAIELDGVIDNDFEEYKQQNPLK